MVAVPELADRSSLPKDDLPRGGDKGARIVVSS